MIFLDDSIVREAFEQLNTLNETACNAVGLSNNKSVFWLNKREKFIRLRTVFSRAGEDLKKNPDSSRIFQSINLEVGRAALQSMRHSTDANITGNQAPTS